MRIRGLSGCWAWVGSAMAGARGDAVLAVLAGLAFLPVYYLTSASHWALPTVFAMDGAEFVIACRQLGVDHPPGHPLYLLVGHLLSLLPVAAPDRAIVLASVLCAAAAVPFLYLLFRELAGWRSAALALALIFGLSFIFWLHGTIIEVYALQTLLQAAFLYVAVRAIKEKAARLVVPLFLSLGALATTATILAGLMSPIALLALALMCARAERRSRMRLALLSLGSLAVGLLPLVYLPLRLSAATYINDINIVSGYRPGSPIWYLWYLSGWEFTGGGLFSHEIGESLSAVLGYLRSLFSNLGPAIVILIPLGLVRLIVSLRRPPRAAPPPPAKRRASTTRRRAPVEEEPRSGPKAPDRQPWLALALIWGLAITTIPVLGYQVADKEVFYLPSFVFAAAVMAVGVSYLRRYRVVFLVSATALVAYQAVAGARGVVPLTRDHQRYQQRLANFLSLPPRSVIVAYDDGQANRYRYFRDILGLRADVVIETFARNVPRFKGDLPATADRLAPPEELRKGIDQVRRVRLFAALAKQYEERQLFLLPNFGSVPDAFPGYQMRRSRLDPELFEMAKREEIPDSDVAPALSVSFQRDPFPGETRLGGWSVRGLDGAGTTSDPAALGPSAGAQALLVREESFELLFSAQRIDQSQREYFAEFFITDNEGNIFEDSYRGFRAAFKLKILPSDTRPGAWHVGSYTFKLPRHHPQGPGKLYMRLFRVRDEPEGELHGQTVRRMSVVPARSDNGTTSDFVLLGNLLVR